MLFLVFGHRSSEKNEDLLLQVLREPPQVHELQLVFDFTVKCLPEDGILHFNLEIRKPLFHFQQFFLSFFFLFQLLSRVIRLF